MTPIYLYNVKIVIITNCLLFILFSASFKLLRLHGCTVCSWQEFCMDVSLEKGGWHLEYSANDYGAVGRKDNSCSSMIDKIVPLNHFSMQGTGYDFYQ